MNKCTRCGSDLIDGKCPACAERMNEYVSKPQIRTFDAEIRAQDDNPELFELSFSSEYPVERYFGVEILDHQPSSVRLDRLKTTGSVLINHKMDMLVGRVESAKIDAARGKATVSFSPSAFAQEKKAEVMAGFWRNVSVSYIIHKIVLESSENDQDTYRVIDWEPVEISLVSVPADPQVGVGRAISSSVKINIPKEERNMEKCTKCGAVLVDGKCPECARAQAIENARAQGGEAEGVRVRGILDLAKKDENKRFMDVALRYIENSRSLEEFTIALAELQRLKLDPVVVSPAIGLTEREIKQFSFIRAINAMLPGGKRDQAGFEFECSEAVSKQLRRTPQGVFVPFEVMQRDLTKGTNNAGGYTVGTTLLAGSFIEMLRNKMMIRALGARVLSGLVGDIAIPSQTGGATAYWVTEGNAPTESQQTIGQVAMTPKTVGAFTDMTRKLLLQSSIDVEAFVRMDLSKVLALAIDLAAINGSSSSNQPVGILNTSGIGSVVGGTNGLAPAWSHIVALETAVADSNADVGALAYLTNAKVRGKLKQTQKVATYGNDFIWENTNEPGVGMVNGYRAAVSNQVPSTLDKGTSTGVCSAIIFGNFDDIVIGEWGAVDLLVDPYTGGAAGTVRVRILEDVDVAIRHAASFAAMVDALTT